MHLFTCLIQMLVGSFNLYNFTKFEHCVAGAIDCIDYVTRIGNAHSIYWHSVFRLRARIYSHS